MVYLQEWEAQISVIRQTSNEVKERDPVEYVGCNILYSMFQGQRYSYYIMCSLCNIRTYTREWMPVHLSMNTCQTFTHKRKKKEKIKNKGHEI